MRSVAALVCSGRTGLDGDRVSDCGGADAGVVAAGLAGAAAGGSIGTGGCGGLSISFTTSGCGAALAGNRG
jgi:hypothetical protein